MGGREDRLRFPSRSALFSYGTECTPGTRAYAEKTVQAVPVGAGAVVEAAYEVANEWRWRGGIGEIAGFVTTCWQRVRRHSHIETWSDVSGMLSSVQAPALAPALQLELWLPAYASTAQRKTPRARADSCSAYDGNSRPYNGEGAQQVISALYRSGTNRKYQLRKSIITPIPTLDKSVGRLEMKWVFSDLRGLEAERGKAKMENGNGKWKIDVSTIWYNTVCEGTKYTVRTQRERDTEGQCLGDTRNVGIIVNMYA